MFELQEYEFALLCPKTLNEAFDAFPTSSLVFSLLQSIGLGGKQSDGSQFVVNYPISYNSYFRWIVVVIGQILKLLKGVKLLR